jgi:hypothetical protein
MKFSLNGALTIGTLDGANVEIREEVGAENFFLFGMTASEVSALKAQGYRPRDYYDQNETLREVIDFIASGALGRGDAELFRPIVENLLDHDPFLLLADYQSYLDAQEQVSSLWKDPEAWTRKSILNTARMGKFSSDRSIRDYCERVWKITPWNLGSLCCKPPASTPSRMIASPLQGAASSDKIKWRFLESRLSVETAPAARGLKRFVSFVNDRADRPCLECLQALGVKAPGLALRRIQWRGSGGGEELGLQSRASLLTLRTAVAEHAIALLLALIAKFPRAVIAFMISTFLSMVWSVFDLSWENCRNSRHRKDRRCAAEICAGLE